MTSPTGSPCPAADSPRVDDPEMLALRMSGEQRVACAALVAAICDNAELAARTVSVVLRAGDGQRTARATGRPAEASVSVQVSVTTDAAPRPLNARRAERLLVQYLAVVRVLFDGVGVRVAPRTVTVGFDYAQH